VLKSLFGKGFVVGFIALCSVLLIPVFASADTTYTPSKYNGVKVYLSPALHSPDKLGCDNFSENQNASSIAHKAAENLKAMGYLVRVGSGSYSTNTSNSNSWGAKYHIPIHSNATTWDCAGSSSSRGGTWVMYDEGYTNSYNLATAIESYMDGYSPGTNDKVLTDTQASGFTYYEFGNSNGIDAYIETAFHTYGPDKNWMLGHSTVGGYIARGIHNGTGAADCRTSTCMIMTSVLNTDLNMTAATPSPAPAKEIAFNYKNHGKRMKELENDIKGLFEDKGSIFSSLSNKSLLNGASVDENGTLVVDFKNFKKGTPSTYQMKQLHDELYEVIFKYDQVQEAYIQFDGSFSDFCNWLEIVEEPMKRK
jgi:hypothetical protein